MRIAILDNDLDQIELARQILTSAGHACQIHRSHTHLLEAAHAGGFDLLIMDGGAVNNCIELLHALRAQPGPRTPVLLLTKRSSDADVATLLEAGASDYIVKPIRRNELEIRVRVLLRRSYPEMDTVAPACFGIYTFDTTATRLTIGSATAAVTQKEFELALLFFRNLGRPLSRAYIREAVWPHEPDVQSRTLDTHVSRVRSKLGLHPENGFRLAPVYSYGYRLEQLAS